VGLSLHPARLKRYKDVARLLFKVRPQRPGRARRARRALAGEELPTGAGAPAPKELSADLERLGPAFIKLGQVLSTRADLPPRLSRGAQPTAGQRRAVLVRRRRAGHSGRFQPQDLKRVCDDEGAVIHGFQKVANRLTLGLLLASLIIGAAMLMRVDTPFRLFGYPGFAMLFFLVAAGGGIWLAFTILSSDRPHRKR
jgi:hypothetical protein